MAEQQGGNPNSSDDFIWGVVGAIIVVGLSWYAFHTEIAIAFLYAADYKVRFLESFMPQTVYLQSLRQWINNINPYTLSFEGLMVLNKSVGSYLMIPFSAGMFYLAYRLYSLPTYTRKFDTTSFNQSESQIWPDIIPALMHDILKEDPHKGKWAVSRSPVEFIQHFKLTDKDGHLIEKKARKILVKQLGAPFKGLKSFNKYERALFGVFCAAILKDKDEAEATLAMLNRSYTGKDINPESGIALAKKYYDDEKIQAIIKKHHFKHALLYAMQQHTRDNAGVMASASYTWLKPLSRHSWYVLNNVGRKVAWADCCSIFGHYHAELLHGSAISKPYLDKAIKGLVQVTKERVI